MPATMKTPFWLNSKHHRNTKPYEQYLVKCSCYIFLTSLSLGVSLSENYLNKGEFWVGLINPDNKRCYDEGCENKLEWASDGSNFENWADISHGIRVNSNKYCLRYKDDGSITSGRGLDDKGCQNSYFYVCQFQCPLTTTTTTTTTITTTTPRGLRF